MTHAPSIARQEPAAPRARLVSLALPFLLILSACGDTSNEPVSAGAGRDAPANVDGDDASPDPAPDAAPDVTPTGDPQPDGPVVDPCPQNPDRILREGGVGEITVVTDGDTVHVTIDCWYHRVRMQGINAPECFKTSTNTADGRQLICSADDEYWGLAAGDALEERALGATVTVTCDQAPGQPCPIDSFDRPLAFLADERGDLGEWMTRNGHAFSFTRFDSTNRALYCEAEDEAIAAERGMWALGDRDEVISRMSDNTRDWYEQRDQRCAEATE